jgi:hypothetical protein
MLFAGRRVTVALARRSTSSQIRSLLRLDARPWVPPALRELFDRPPDSFHAAALALTCLFGAAHCYRWVPCVQDGFVLTME